MVNKRRFSGTRILLIRHGETNWNRIRRFQGRSDLPLNPTGRDQARALALALKDEPLNAIYSSPLVRAIETVYHIMAFHPSVPVFNEEGLVEMDLGDFEGLEAQHWANFVNLTILCYALEVPLDRFREIRQDTAALNILYMKGKQLKAEVVNERSHLQRLKEKMTD
jgi:broad specificity phosphatase PhoE